VDDELQEVTLFHPLLSLPGMSSKFFCSAVYELRLTHHSDTNDNNGSRPQTRAHTSNAAASAPVPVPVLVATAASGGKKSRAKASRGKVRT
jgi:hypothetical protein